MESLSNSLHEIMTNHTCLIENTIQEKTAAFEQTINHTVDEIIQDVYVTADAAHNKKELWKTARYQVKTLLAPWQLPWCTVTSVSGPQEGESNGRIHTWTPS